jgi:hypothetical protein
VTDKSHKKGHYEYINVVFVEEPDQVVMKIYAPFVAALLGPNTDPEMVYVTTCDAKNQETSYCGILSPNGRFTIFKKVPGKHAVGVGILVPNIEFEIDRGADSIAGQVTAAFIFGLQGPHELPRLVKVSFEDPTVPASNYTGYLMAAGQQLVLRKDD